LIAVLYCATHLYPFGDFVEAVQIYEGLGFMLTPEQQLYRVSSDITSVEEKIMTTKQQVLTQLQDEFNRWEELLAGLTETQLTAPQLAANWSVKDVIAHLWVWQQRSIARLEAALADREPVYPPWPEEFDPEMEGEPDQLNAWLYDQNRDKPWSQVYQDWKTDCAHYLALGERVAEADLLTPGRYGWLEGLPLIAILHGTDEHYTEHREWLVPRLRELNVR
jgi:hypothetical protein